ncbi:MAG: glycosyltransferase [Anditalea sp.]
MFFSVVIPVFNRPMEIKELLESLVRQVYKNFEVLIVEDGSVITCEEIVNSYQEKLNIRYLFQSNKGQGFARNFGMRNAQGDYFVLFDSDCIVPPNYMGILNHALKERRLDAHGGPDAAAEDFSVFQKAINFSMTSWWTTGGIRGKLKTASKYQARGYNMGLSKAVFLETKGFIDPNKGEDIELSIRIKRLGYKLELIKEAFVYHNRKNDFGSFLAQSFSFGRNRINVSRYHQGSIKFVHFLPLAFLLGWLAWTISFFLFLPGFYLGTVIFGLWTLGVFLSASIQNRSLFTGIVTVFTSYGQLFSYGAGFSLEGFIKMLKG